MTVHEKQARYTFVWVLLTAGSFGLWQASFLAGLFCLSVIALGFATMAQVFHRLAIDRQDAARQDR
jgi:hypothetical protein